MKQSDYDDTRKNLDYILKKGDLFDVIAKHENVRPSEKPFLRGHLLLFSRILYGTLAIYDNIAKHFAPVNKVHEAQNKIRKALGVNADIIRSKDYETELLKFYKKPSLALLYDDDISNKDNYLGNLKKIYAFCELYNIPRVYLFATDINSLFPGIDFQNYDKFSISVLLGSNLKSFETFLKELTHPYDENEENAITATTIIKLDLPDLKELINTLEGIKTDKKYIIDLGSHITDYVITKAIASFLNDNDFAKLKETVKMRLNLHLNSDSTYKDRVYGKVSENISIEGEFLRVLVKSNEGKIISNKVVSFYDYFDILNYDALLEEIKRGGDDALKFAITALYLYLCKINIKSSKSEKIVSLYDEVWLGYQAKKKDKKEGIPYLFSKGYKWSKNIVDMAFNLFVTYALIALILVGFASVDFVRDFFFHYEGESIKDNFLEMIIKPYKYSWTIEAEIIDRFVYLKDDMIEDFREG